VVLLQNRSGNVISVSDLLSANPQYSDVTKIPAGAVLNVPVRTGDNLTIYCSDGVVGSATAAGNVAGGTAGMGANPSGPQVARGKDPIVYVPLGEQVPGGVRQVTAGMVSSRVNGTGWAWIL